MVVLNIYLPQDPTAGKEPAHHHTKDEVDHDASGQSD